VGITRLLFIFADMTDAGSRQNGVGRVCIKFTTFYVVDVVIVIVINPAPRSVSIRLSPRPSPAPPRETAAICRPLSRFVKCNYTAKSAADAAARLNISGRRRRAYSDLMTSSTATSTWCSLIPIAAAAVDVNGRRNLINSTTRFSGELCVRSLAQSLAKLLVNTRNW